uniref:Uncharacterized protein n=1 Tax=Globodera rostochiensis TaxID=31243 RepID=A0A914HDM2_GLORO
MLPGGDGGGGWRCPTDVCLPPAMFFGLLAGRPATQPTTANRSSSKLTTDGAAALAKTLYTTTHFCFGIWPNLDLIDGKRSHFSITSLCHANANAPNRKKKQMSTTITGSGSFWSLFFCAMLLQNMFTIVCMVDMKHNGGVHQSSRGERLRANVNRKNAAIATAGITALAGGAIAMNKMNKRRANANNDGMPQGPMPMMPGMMAPHPQPNHLIHGY